MMSDPELTAKLDAKRRAALKILGPNWLAHRQNAARFKPAKLSLLEQFQLGRRNELQGG